MLALDTIRVLWRQPDTMSLWGIPYDMRPGQQPYDLWRARERPVYGFIPSLTDWIYLGAPGWWCGTTDEDVEACKAFLERWKEYVPQGPCEWSTLPK